MANFGGILCLAIRHGARPIVVRLLRRPGLRHAAHPRILFCEEVEVRSHNVAVIMNQAMIPSRSLSNT